MSHQSQLSQAKLKIPNRADWLRFLDATSRINKSAIITLSDGLATSLVSSSDNTLILYAEIDGIESSFRGTINVPDISKLIRVIESINTEGIEFTLNNNNITYESSNLKFKYHLFEEGFLTKPSINVEKIKSFKYNINFNLQKNILQNIIKGSSFAAETNKLYLYTEDGRLKGELTDRAKHNTDVFSLNLGDVDFSLQPLPLNLDNIRIISTISDNLAFNINTEYGVTVIDIAANDIKLKYILTSLTQ